MFEVSLHIVVAVIVAICGILLLLRYERIIKPIERQFIGPVPWPIVGNILQLGYTPDAYLRTIFKWLDQYNYKNLRIWMGPIPYVALVETKYAEHMLSSTVLTYKYDPYNMLYPWLGKGLLTANDHQWSLRRKLITPSFHYRILKDFLVVMNETSSRFMVLLEKESVKSQDRLVDIQKLVSRSTIDIICETAMGIRVNSIEGQPSPIVSAIDTLCYSISERVLSLFKRLDLFYKCTSLYWQQERAIATLQLEFKKIIEHRRRLLQTSSYQQSLQEEDENLDATRPKMAFLDSLLTAEVEGKPLTLHEILEEVSTFMFEGHDTTASAITFAIYCMAWTPRVQQRAYEEQVQIYGDSKERHPTYQELQDMKYLDLVIKETLRLFPSVPFIFRATREPTVILDKYLPENTTILLPIIAYGHNPHSFEEPCEGHIKPHSLKVCNDY